MKNIFWTIWHTGAIVYAIMALLGIIIMAWAYFRAPVLPPSYEDTLFDDVTEWRHDFDSPGQAGPETAR